MEVECRYTIGVLAWCSMHQLPGCKYIVKPLHILFRCICTLYMSMYGHMQPYIHAI